ncbi:hypothetical protein B5X24_HaOG214192 [Helicoverpa armigera]|nr:hypothetical protein B5X24_HaOG214192 [Helicoverpa armigera]
MSHASELASKLQVESAKLPTPSVSVSNYSIKDLCTKRSSIKAVPGVSAATCVFCGGSHRIYDCSTFLAKSVEDRQKEAARLKLCINCLHKIILKPLIQQMYNLLRLKLSVSRIRMSIPIL